jgi:hypothetical protein
MKTLAWMTIILCWAGNAFAQLPVTSVYTHYINATTARSYSGNGATGPTASGITGNTYQYRFGTNVATPNVQLLDSFTVGGLIYHFLPDTPKVVFRRIDNTFSTPGLRKALWFEYSGAGVSGPGGTAALLPDYDDSLERIFSKRIFNIGIDNNFQKDSATNNNNIERVDVIFRTGLQALHTLTKVGFVVFDRGAGGTHDPFYIAAIKSLDANGNPASYYNAVAATTADYGNIASTALNYHIFRKNPGDAELLLLIPNTNQQRDGVFFTFQSLNVPSTTTVIYGYSIFGPDVVVTPATNMVNDSIAANFPTNSNYSNGGLDQVAVTGIALTADSNIVLATKIVSFGAQYAAGEVQLNWQLATDNESLTIDRSGDGVVYSPIFTLQTPPVGPGGAIDRQPLAGENYYRLSLGNAGTATYSSVAEVVINKTPPISLNIYPIPIRNRSFTVSASGLKNDVYQLRVFGMTGKLCYRQTLQGDLSIQRQVSLPGYIPTGYYVVQLIDGNGRRVANKTILVE